MKSEVLRLPLESLEASTAWTKLHCVSACEAALHIAQCRTGGKSHHGTKKMVPCNLVEALRKTVAAGKCKCQLRLQVDHFRGIHEYHP